MRQRVERLLISIILALFAVSCSGGEDTPHDVADIATGVGVGSTADTGSSSSSTGDSKVAAGTAVINVGGRRWTFSLSEGPAARCKFNTLGNKGGITAIGYEMGSDGALLPGGSSLEMNIHPENWVPQGTQSHLIKIIGPGDAADWNTASPKLIKDNPGVSALTRAVVHSWKLQGGWTSGAATFYLKDSLSDAQMGGELEMADGTFELLCPEQ